MSSAALEALYAPARGVGKCPEIDVVTTMAPRERTRNGRVRGLGQQPGGASADRERAVVVIDRQVFERAAAAYPGVADQHVDAAELVLRGAHGGSWLVGGRQVGRDRAPDAAGTAGHKQPHARQPVEVLYSGCSGHLRRL
jgi:hypothetical protein